MNGRRPAAKTVSAAKPAGAPKGPSARAASPYRYAFMDWLAKEDPEYIKARQPLSDLSFGDGKELPIKYREMVAIGIIAFRGRQDGVVAQCAGLSSTARPSASCSKRFSPRRCRAVDRRSAPACRR